MSKEDFIIDANNKEEIEYESKFFITEEIEYLQRRFKYLTLDQKKLDLDDFLFVVENKTLCKHLFRSIVRKDEREMDFEGFEKLCGIILRGCIETKLQLLYDILKDENDPSFLVPDLTKKKIFEITDHVHNAKIITHSDNNIRVNKIQVVEEFMNKIFKDGEKINKIQYLRRSFTCSSILLVLDLMEKEVERMVDNMDVKLKTKKIRIPLTKIVTMEGNFVPSSISKICTHIKETISSLKYFLEDESNEYKGSFPETLTNYLLLNDERDPNQDVEEDEITDFDENQDLSKISFHHLLFSLKSILFSFPAPLLTYLFSKQLLDKKISSNKEKQLLMIRYILINLPLPYRNTVVCVLDSIHSLFQLCNSTHSKKLISELLAPCFFLINNPSHLKRAISYVSFMIENADQFFFPPKRIEIEIMNDPKTIYSKLFLFNAKQQPNLQPLSPRTLLKQKRFRSII